MSAIKHPFLVAAIALVVGIVLVVAASQASPVVRHHGAAEVSAYGGTVAWSQYSRRERRYRLMQQVGGQVLDTEVPASRDLFDVDVGPSLAGGPVGVYPRCHAPHGAEGGAYDCGIYAYDFTQAVQFEVEGADRKRCIELVPSTWNEAVAFGRQPAATGPNQHAERPGCEQGLYVVAPGEPVRRVAGGLPTGTDLQGNLLAASFVHPGGRHDRIVKSSVVLFDLAAGTRRSVAKGEIDRFGFGPLLFGPVLDGNTLYYVSSEGPSFSRVVGQSIGPGGSNVITDGLRIDSLGVDRGRIYYTNQHGVFRLP